MPLLRENDPLDNSSVAYDFELCHRRFQGSTHGKRICLDSYHGIWRMIIIATTCMHGTGSRQTDSSKPRRSYSALDFAVFAAVVPQPPSMIVQFSRSRPKVVVAQLQQKQRSPERCNFCVA